MRTEAWWVCSECKLAVKKVGKAGGSNLDRSSGHREACPRAGYSIEQIPQQELPRRRWKKR